MAANLKTRMHPSRRQWLAAATCSSVEPVLGARVTCSRSMDVVAVLSSPSPLVLALFYLAESLRFIMTRLSQHKMQNRSEMTYIGRSPNLLSIDPQLEEDV